MKKRLKNFFKLNVGKKNKIRRELMLGMLNANNFCIAYNKNQNTEIWNYMLSEDKNNLFVYDDKTYFLMIGNFEIKNQDILKEDIESVRLMCNDRLIIGSNTFVTGMERENKGYNELFPKEVVNNLNDWYYEIKYKSDDGIKTEILKINNKEIR